MVDNFRSFSGVITFVLLFSTSVFADGAQFYVDRTPAPICSHEEDRTSGLESLTGGRNSQEILFSSASIFSNDELACLRRKGLASTGEALSPDNFTTARDLNNFYDQCTFVQTPQEFRDLGRITERVHLDNRDRLSNGLWQDLANRSTSQLRCRIDTINQHQTNPQARSNLDARAGAQFDRILDRVRGLLLMKRATNNRNLARVYSDTNCGGFGGWITCHAIAEGRSEADHNRLDRAIAQEFSKIPFGYEPDVAESLVAMADRGAFNSEEFGAALVRSQNRYQQLNNYYINRNGESAVSPGGNRWCIDEEFKAKAVRSGTLKKLLDSYPESTMSTRQKAVLECKLVTKYQTSQDNQETVANGLFLVAGAGAAIMTAIPSGGGSVAAFGAAASLGVGVTSFAYQVQRAHEACTRRDFLISPDGTETCNPEEDFQKELSEFKLQECATQVGFAALEAVFIPLDIRAIVRARQSSRISDLIDDAAISREIREIQRTGRVSEAAQAIDDTAIVVTGRRPERFFNEREFAAIEARLAGRQITDFNNISADVFRSLSPEEKVFVIQRLSTGLSPEKGRQLERFFRRYPDGQISDEALAELRGILSLNVAAARSAETDEFLRLLEEEGYIRTPGGRGPPAPGRVDVPQPTPDMIRRAGLLPEGRAAEASEFLGVRLDDSQRAALEAAHLHGRAPGVGFYTYPPEVIFQKGLILRNGGFTAPQIRRLVEEGFVGDLPAAARPGFFARLFGGGRSSGPPLPENAREIFRNTGEEVTDAQRLSPEVARPAGLRSSDLFAPRFTGTIDEMIRTGAWRNNDLYQGNRQLWWTDAEISGAESLDPFVRNLGLRVGGPQNVRRLVSWPNRQIEATAAAASRRDVALDSYRVVANQVRNEAGQWVDDSIEVIARDPATGEYVPMLYVRQGDEMVPARTFEGQPILQACIKCHHRPPNKTVFTPFPFAGVRLPHRVAHGYQPFARPMVEAAGDSFLPAAARFTPGSPMPTRAELLESGADRIRFNSAIGKFNHAGRTEASNAVLGYDLSLAANRGKRAMIINLGEQYGGRELSPADLTNVYSRLQQAGFTRAESEALVLSGAATSPPSGTLPTALLLP